MAASSEFKVKVEKLEGPEDWPQWKWQMHMLLCSHGLEGLIDGSNIAPTVTADSPAEDQQKLVQWKKDNAKASSFIAGSLTRPIADLVLTTTVAREIWEKLCARFERSSAQRLNMLIEMFFQSGRVETEDISTHIAKLRKLFTDLNVELKKNAENTLSERMLIGRILFTLGREHNFSKISGIRYRLRIRSSTCSSKSCAPSNSVS